MIHYKVYQDNRKTSKRKGYWYARSVVVQTYDLEKLADFNPAKHIYKPHLRARASGSLMAARLKQSVHLREYDKYDKSIKESKKGEKKVEKKNTHSEGGEQPEGPVVG